VSVLIEHFDSLDILHSILIIPHLAHDLPHKSTLAALVAAGKLMVSSEVIRLFLDVKLLLIISRLERAKLGGLQVPGRMQMVVEVRFMEVGGLLIVGLFCNDLPSRLQR